MSLLLDNHYVTQLVQTLVIQGNMHVSYWYMYVYCSSDGRTCSVYSAGLLVGGCLLNNKGQARLFENLTLVIAALRIWSSTQTGYSFVVDGFLYNRTHLGQLTHNMLRVGFTSYIQKVSLCIPLNTIATPSCHRF